MLLFIVVFSLYSCFLFLDSNILKLMIFMRLIVWFFLQRSRSPLKLPLFSKRKWFVSLSGCEKRPVFSANLYPVTSSSHSIKTCGWGGKVGHHFYLCLLLPCHTPKRECPMTSALLWITKQRLSKIFRRSSSHFSAGCGSVVASCYF